MEIFYIIAKPPPEQYCNCKIKLIEFKDENRSLIEYEDGGVIVFDDILGSSNGKYTDQFFIRGRQKNCDIYYLPQSYFDLAKRTIQKTSNKIILYKQTLKDIENIYRDVGGYDMSQDDFKQLCRKSCEEEYNYLCLDNSKRRDPGTYCIFNES